MTVSYIDRIGELSSDGDTIEIDETRKLRLRIEVDPDASVNDSDCYGKVSEYSFNYQPNYRYRDGYGLSLIHILTIIRSVVSPHTRFIVVVTRCDDN